MTKKISYLLVVDGVSHAAFLDGAEILLDLSQLFLLSLGNGPVLGEEITPAK